MDVKYGRRDGRKDGHGVSVAGWLQTGRPSKFLTTQPLIATLLQPQKEVKHI
jgi:hypothetical protein